MQNNEEDVKKEPQSNSIVYQCHQELNNDTQHTRHKPTKGKAISSLLPNKLITMPDRTDQSAKLSYGATLLAAQETSIHRITRPCITKIRLYNFDPLKPHFYTVKLGFTGVYVIFPISAQNIDYGYPLEPPRRGGSNEYPQSIF